MKISYHWLKKLLPGLKATPAQVADRLTFSGVEVEAMTDQARALDGVVTALVESVEPHPDSDHLHLTRVNDGTETHGVVCGAANVAAGQKVVLARLGVLLPNGIRIERRKIRGADSAGMICSLGELGLPGDSGGILVLPERTKVGKPAAKVLELDDVILEIAPTPNRPDVLSHFGLARELAALFELPPPRLEVDLDEQKSKAEARVRLEDERCPRYLARLITGVKVGPSPDWVVRRLAALGQRSVSNVVDATNLCLLELGHPLHAFDLDKLSSAEIVVRRARPGESLELIDGGTKNLDPDDLVIADAERAVALAGVMGGRPSAVSDGTTRILLESAYFDPKSVRRTGKRHGLHTEASHRFERGADPEMLAAAIDRCAALIVELAGGQVLRGRPSAQRKQKAPPAVSVRPARASQVIGLPLDKRTVKRTLARLGLRAVAKGTGKGKRHKGALHFQVPSWRVDLAREEDLIEELARLVGMDAVPSVMPPGPRELWAEVAAPVDPERRLRGHLAEAGYLECVSLAFHSEADAALLGLPVARAVRVANPLGEESALMRLSLIPALLKAVVRNQDVLPSITDLRLAELGRTFVWGSPPAALPEESLRLALILRGHRSVERWNTKAPSGAHPEVDAYDVKAAVEGVLALFRVAGARFEPDDTPWLHPGSRTRVLAQGRLLGVFGQVHPDVLERSKIEGRPVYAAELLVQELVLAGGAEPIYRPLPRHPPARRDLSFFVGRDVPAAEILATIRESPSPVAELEVEDVEVFDVYEGKGVQEGQKSLAVAITYRAQDRTLTDAEVKLAEAHLIGLLQSRHGAQVRMG